MEKRSHSKWRYLAVILGIIVVESLSAGSALASLVSMNDLFSPTLILGDKLNIDPAYKDRNETYSPCIKIEYPKATPPAEKIEGYATVIWRYPIDNLGKLNGRNLNGAIRLNIWARSDNTMKNVTFSVGAFREDSDIIPITATLNENWRRFEIPLFGRNLSNIKAGFACKLTENGVIYLNGVSYEI